MKTLQDHGFGGEQKLFKGLSINDVTEWEGKGNSEGIIFIRLIRDACDVIY